MCKNEEEFPSKPKRQFGFKNKSRQKFQFIPRRKMQQKLFMCITD